MALFRTVSDADVREMLAAFGVGGYRAHHPIAVGTINTNLRVETDAEQLFLRINEGKSEDDVWRDNRWWSHLRFELTAGEWPDVHTTMRVSRPRPT